MGDYLVMLLLFVLIAFGMQSCHSESMQSKKNEVEMAKLGYCSSVSAIDHAQVEWKPCAGVKP